MSAKEWLTTAEVLLDAYDEAQRQGQAQFTRFEWLMVKEMRSRLLAHLRSHPSVATGEQQ